MKAKLLLTSIVAFFFCVSFAEKSYGQVSVRYLEDGMTPGRVVPTICNDYPFSVEVIYTQQLRGSPQISQGTYVLNPHSTYPAWDPGTTLRIISYRRLN